MLQWYTKWNIFSNKIKLNSFLLIWSNYFRHKEGGANFNIDFLCDANYSLYKYSYILMTHIPPLYTKMQPLKTPNLIKFIAISFIKKCDRTGIIFLFYHKCSSIWCVRPRGKCLLANMQLLPDVSWQSYDFTFIGEMSTFTLHDQAIKPSRNAGRQTTSDAATHLKSGTSAALLWKNINLHIYRFRCKKLRMEKKVEQRIICIRLMIVNEVWECYLIYPASRN